MLTVTRRASWGAGREKASVAMCIQNKNYTIVNKRHNKICVIAMLCTVCRTIATFILSTTCKCPRVHGDVALNPTQKIANKSCYYYFNFIIIINNRIVPTWVIRLSDLLTRVAATRLESDWSR